VIASAVLFAAIHWEPAHIAAALPMGLFLGCLRWRCNSLLPPAIAHAINNSTFVLMAKYLDVF
jgi:hypothetical protein